MGGAHSRPDEIAVPIALGIEQSGQIGMVEAGMGGVRHRRLGAIGDAQSCFAEHCEIIGPVANRKRRFRRQMTGLPQLKQAFALGLAAQNRIFDRPRDFVLPDHQPVRAMFIKAEMGCDRSGKQREPA